MQCIGALSLAVAVVISKFYGEEVTAWQWMLVIVTALAPFITHAADGVWMQWKLAISAVINLLSIAFGLALLVGQAVHPLMWLLPIGLSLNLTSATMYIRPWEYVLTGASVWAVLLYVIQPPLGLDMESVFIVFTMATTLCVGSAMCISFKKLRLDAYDLQQQLHRIANVDVLTSLPNRRAFLQGMEVLLQQPMPDRGLYFLMLDVDDFKKINDHFGHDVGDQALTMVARTMEAQAVGLCFGRLGGEEFAVLARLSEEDALALAGNIVAAVHDCMVKGRFLSLSIGMALHQPNEPVDNLMRRADLALYDAKHAGKNRYMLAAA